MNQDLKEKNNAALFFVKYPEKGKVKSRLSKKMDESQVLILYKNFVEDLLDMLNTIDCAKIVCYYPSSEIDSFKNWLDDNYKYLPQKGENLGERLKNCFVEGFNLGYEKLIVIGSDSPDLTAEIINDSFKKLDEFDSVIGPCEDGGYYLLGFKKNSFLPNIFNKIPWSTSEVFKKSIEIFNKSNYNFFVLPKWLDVDTIDDLESLYIKNKGNKFQCSKTMDFLNKFYKNQQSG
jgi:rSAM/selenodomain-associated transferase 1